VECLEHDDAHGPDVRLVPVLVPQEALGAHVLNGAAPRRVRVRVRVKGLGSGSG
jgi:hypothetical protein